MVRRDCHRIPSVNDAQVCGRIATPRRTKAAAASSPKRASLDFPNCKRGGAPTARLPGIEVAALPYSSGLSWNELMEPNERAEEGTWRGEFFSSLARDRRRPVSAKSKERGSFKVFGFLVSFAARFRHPYAGCMPDL